MFDRAQSLSLPPEYASTSSEINLLVSRIDYQLISQINKPETVARISVSK